MGIYVNPNNANFQEALNSPIYVDKSLLIAEINRLVCTTKKFVCVSRSRRFGKTMAGNMLSAYFSKGCDSRELFAGLKIAKDPGFEKYLNKFNVIKLDVNAVYSNLSKKEQEEKVDRATRDITPIFNGAVVKELLSIFPNCEITDDDSIAYAIQKIYMTITVSDCTSCNIRKWIVRCQEQFIFHDRSRTIIDAYIAICVIFSVSAT